MARRRSSTRALAQLLDASPLPMYVLDQQRRLIYCNKACLRWTGVEAEQLIDQRCDYHCSPMAVGAAEVAAGLCPPPEVFQGQRESSWVACRTPDGRLSRRRADFFPLGEDSQDCAGVIVVVGGEVNDEDFESDLPHEPSPAELHQRLVRHHWAERFQLDQFVGESSAIRRVREQMALAVERRTRVLVVGPPGSGREHVARTIHYGDRQQSFGHLVPLSCSLLDAELLQSTITEFVRQVEQLESGQAAALMLLDVDQLPREAQQELAGFLELPELELPTIATARVPLLELAAKGLYHPDLAYALSTLVIELPSLADRPQDIPLLAQYFLEQCNAEGGRQLSGFADEALDQLTAYGWPENVDELAETVRQCCRRAEGPLVQAEDLPASFEHDHHRLAHPRRADEVIQLDEFLADVEMELIRRALERAKGNKAQAARLLGVTRARLHRRASQLGLD